MASWKQKQEPVNRDLEGVGQIAVNVFETRWRWVMATLGFLSVISLTVQHGFRASAEIARWLHAGDLALAVGFIAGLFIELRRAKHRATAVLHRRLEIGAVALFAVALLFTAFAPAETLSASFAEPGRISVFFAAVKLFLLINVCIQALRTLQGIFVSGVRAEVILAGSFAVLIVVGTLLLLLPGASARPEARISLSEAFFTATSAVCVTGLVVRDTGTDFSTLGQMTILALFQIGGLGIVTFVAFISAFSSRTLPVPQMATFRQIINAPAIGDLKRRIIGIVVLTLSIELIGAAILFQCVTTDGTLIDRLKWCLFHSVSAFCNAGFAFSGTSLEFARAHAGLNWTIMVLIVLGSLGFLVLPELLGRLAAAVKRLPFLLRLQQQQFVPRLPRITIQTRISLYVTAALLVFGTIAFWLLERGHSLHGMGPGESFLVSSFQSVTTRTAGFNTVPIGQLQQATLLMMMALMVIGGSPVSASGGIKTVTVGVLLVALRSMIFRREKVEAFGRTIPQRVFFTALNVAVLYAVTAMLTVFLLSAFDPQVPLRDTLFETISALSTVGLSTGITADLGRPSQLVLCLAMFIGRVGPIALVLSVFQSRGRVEYEYPSEDVVVS